MSKATCRIHTAVSLSLTHVLCPSPSATQLLGTCEFEQLVGRWKGAATKNLPGVPDKLTPDAFSLASVYQLSAENIKKWAAIFYAAAAAAAPFLLHPPCLRAVILSFFSQTAQRPKKYAMKVGSSHAAHHLEGLKFDQSSKAKAKKTRWRGGKKEKKREKRKYEWAYIHANWLAQITTYAKGPQGRRRRRAYWVPHSLGPCDVCQFRHTLANLIKISLTTFE